MNFRVGNVWKFVRKNRIPFLIGSGGVLMIVSNIFTAKATVKSVEKLQAMDAVMVKDGVKEDNGWRKIPNGVKIKACAKYYVPSMVVTAAGATSLIFGGAESSKEIAASVAEAAAATIVSERATKNLETYKNKVKEAVGEEKEEEIAQSVEAEKQFESNPLNKAVVQNTKNGADLFYDAVTDTYFYHNLDEVKDIGHRIRDTIKDGAYFTKADYRMIFDLKSVDTEKYGDADDEFGWISFRDGLPELKIGSKLAEDGTTLAYIIYMSRKPIRIPPEYTELT